MDRGKLNDLVDYYFERFSWVMQSIDVFDDDRYEIIVVIPAKDEKYILNTLQSLDNCKTAIDYGVLVVVNAASTDPSRMKDQNLQTIEEIISFKKKTKINIEAILENELDPKSAGVGLARKIGMDTALRHFGKTGIDGVILCLDADCLISSNYLEEVHKAFQQIYDDVFATIYFEHQDIRNNELREAIHKYELHLRYYINGLRYADYPFSMHTVGSCMAVKASTYARYGGMNRRKAGEDFYFINKLAPNVKHIYINDATVFPSARKSQRVPFGTGSTMHAIAGNIADFYTYNPLVFERLKELVCSFNRISKSDISVKVACSNSREFLLKSSFEKAISGITKNTSSNYSFRKQLFNWFNGFRVLKFIHHMSGYYPRKEVSAASKDLLGINTNDIEKLLHLYRELDKKAGKQISFNSGQEILD